MASGYENLSRYEVDGTNFFETNLAFKQAVERARRGKGPSIIISNVVRLLPHSSSDDQRKYRTPEDLEKDLQKDPILLFKNNCVNEKIFTENDIVKIEKQVNKQIDEDAIWAEDQDHPDVDTALNYVYSEENTGTETKLVNKSENIVMVDAINHALHEEMAKNEKMIIYGQDIADPKGGVFTATKGLSSTFGKELSLIHI